MEGVFGYGVLRCERATNAAPTAIHMAPIAKFLAKQVMIPARMKSPAVIR
jgi:hypothetical protein